MQNLHIFSSYPSCSGAIAPGLAGDMHFRDEVIAFIGPSCAFALEPVARLAAYWNTPIITGMGDQVYKENSKTFFNSIKSKSLYKWIDFSVSISSIIIIDSHHYHLLYRHYTIYSIKAVYYSYYFTVPLFQFI